MYRPPSTSSDKENANIALAPIKRSSDAANAPPKRPLGDLSQPFAVPFKQGISKYPRRSTRKRVNYRELAAGDGESENFEQRKSFFSLDLDGISTRKLLAKPFRIPSSKLSHSEHAGSLGFTRVPEWKAKPLHDPCGEFAIVLFDPSVDVLPDATSEQDLEVSSMAKYSNEQKAKKKKQAQQADTDEDFTLDGSNSDSKDGGEAATAEPEKPKIRLAGSDLGDVLGLNKPKEDVNKPTLVPVVIDPKLARILRPHQIEGTKFLYRCTMGLSDPRVHGCIMADEMGLGKTLQCITLLWTMLKQSPAPTANRRGTIEKAIVVCPSSLVLNWANEFTKWLGPNAVNCLAIDGRNIKGPEIAKHLDNWARASGRSVVQPVLVISYETLRRNTEVLGQAEIGLMLADEGHRLKNAESYTFESLTKLNARRRVILSGTPIQNDLSEYFSLLDFANPGFLGTRADFRKNFENKIVKMGYLGSTEEECREGNERLQEMLQNVSRFIIRRTNDILSKYLPVKYEHVVFCGLTDFQKKVYTHYLQSKEVNRMLKGQGTQTLQGINMLKKLCNHPDLLDLTEEIPGSDKYLPDDWVPVDQRTMGRNRAGAARPNYSGKFMVLARMLARIRNETNDKIVLISNYTQTLDLIESMCREYRYGTIRLDGTMATNKRQRLVDRFNDPEQPEFVFLLSSKAGGCGINLIGANRLILLDPDWNPASDQQALARVWRDGQKKSCFIYRFIATGTIEEKILQRQSMKMSLSSVVVDEKTDVERLFTSDMLKALFQYNDHTQCDTHDTFNCKRCTPERQTIGASAMLYGDTTTWNHYPRGQLDRVADQLLQQEIDKGVVDFVFQYISI